MTAHETTIHDTVTAVNANQWNNLVTQSDLGTVFHRYEWLRAVEAGLDRPAYHAVVTKGSNPVAVLPTVLTPVATPDPADLPGPDRVVEATASHLPTERLVSLYPGTGGPVIATDHEACLDSMLSALTTAAPRQALSHKIRLGSQAQNRYSKYLIGQGYESTVTSCRLVLDLAPGWDHIRSGMDRTRRTELRNDAVTVERTDFDGPMLASIHANYVQNMERIGADSFPMAFFEALAENLDERVEVFTAHREGDTLGQHICIVDEEQSALRYYFSAIPETSAYEYGTSEQLHGAAIQWAIDAGFESYDFGATGADFRDGLFTYKSQYGPAICPIVQWDRGLSAVAWRAFKFGRRLYRGQNY